MGHDRQRSWHIVSMEDKIIVDWENDKTGSSSQPVGRWKPAEEAEFGSADTSRSDYQSTDEYWELAETRQSTGVHDELVGRRQPTDEDESDLDEEKAEAVKPKSVTDGRRCPLRQRRAPCQFLDKECALLIEKKGRRIASNKQ